MGDLTKRFEGPENAARLRQAMLAQKVVAGDEILADRLIALGKLRELTAGDVLITQGAWDTEIYFILAGEFNIVINGQHKAVRGHGVHVGELSGADPARARTATVTANTESLVLQVTDQTIIELASDNADFWRRVANVVADRLDERNAEIAQTNDIPRVFVISSTEGKQIAEEVVLNLDGQDVAVHVWGKGTFGLSDYPVSSVMDAIERSDFTISIVRGDDSLIVREQQVTVARDNVHLEYGISLGMLGRPRSLLLICADESLKLPSDLAGLTTLRYRDGSDDEMRRSVRNACIEARKHILEEGVFRGRKVS